jgi:hypothetical protein
MLGHILKLKLSRLAARDHEIEGGLQLTGLEFQCISGFERSVCDVLSG